jgi:hypothetical protein
MTRVILPGIFVFVLLAAAAGITQSPVAHASSFIDLRIISGMASTSQYAYPHSDPCGTAYWHCDDASFPANAGLDLHDAAGSDDRDVWFEAYPGSGSGYAYAVTSNHNDGVSLCPGVNINFWVPVPDSNTGTWIGWENYVQINPSITFGTSFYTSTTGWTLLNLGHVAQLRPCSSWTGAHLHQDGGTGAGIYSNWSLDDDNGAGFGLGINPTGDYNYNFLHQLYY